MTQAEAVAFIQKALKEAQDERDRLGHAVEDALRTYECAREEAYDLLQALNEAKAGYWDIQLGHGDEERGQICRADIDSGRRL